MQIICVPTGPWSENTYIATADGARCVLIDPGDGVEDISRALGQLVPEAVFLTHFHYDHTISSPYFKRKYRCPVYVSEKDAEKLEDPDANAYNMDLSLSSLPAPCGIEPLFFGESAEVAGMRFTVIPTPGHSRGSVCLYLEDEGVLFSGDTLFNAGIGRMDLYGADRGDMLRSLRTLFALPAETRVYPGHGDATTIGAERARYTL